MKIQIIGGGNVAFHLFKALTNVGLNVSMVNSRSLKGFDPEATITILAVSDNAIRDVALRLGEYSGLLCHTSGTSPLSILDSTFPHTGVFYPMQTFSKDISLTYSEIPFFIEAGNEEDLGLLMSVARKISPMVEQCNSEKRKILHIAAVLSCNFTNHLFSLASLLLKEYSIPFEYMLPLIKVSVEKVTSGNPPRLCQTGPASRNDLSTIASHLSILAKSDTTAPLTSIYSILSNSIITMTQQPHTETEA